MRTFIYWIAFALCFFGASYAQAESQESGFTPRFELSTGVSLVGPSGSVQQESSGSLPGTYTNVVLGGSVGMFVTEHFEISVNPSVISSHDAAGGSQFEWNFLLGPTYNFLGPVASSFYVSVQVGVEGVSMTDYERSSALAYSIILGKRFSLFEHVSYNPSIAYVHVNSMTMTPSQDVSMLAGFSEFEAGPVNRWSVSPIQFSILF